MTPDELTAYLYEHIPISRGLGVRVELPDDRSVRLTAPLAPNLNHRGTAFGGSLSAIAILSGWALLHLQLRGRGVACQIVIQRSAFDFDAPVDGDLCATATLPAPEPWARFLATLDRHRSARIAVGSTVECASGVGGRHQGTYVAMRA